MDARACYRGPHVDQFIDWGDPPVFEARAVTTGVYTNYSVTVRRLEVWVVEAHEATEPRRLEVYQHREEAMDDVQELVTLPDRRGIERNWVIRDQCR
jgi:hypothetical protein